MAIAIILTACNNATSIPVGVSNNSSSTFISVLPKTIPKKPDNISQKLWNDSFKIVKEVELRMSEGLAPSTKDQIFFDDYYVTYWKPRLNDDRKKEERSFASLTVDLFWINQEYVSALKGNDPTFRVSKMEHYKLALERVRDAFNQK